MLWHNNLNFEPIPASRGAKKREAFASRPDMAAPATIGYAQRNFRGYQMRRREFIAGVTGVVALPLAARAQQSAMPAVGYLSGGSPGDPLDTTAYFRRGLSETGFVEGRNVSIEYRWAEGDNSRLTALVADLVRRQVAVIAIPNTTASALAAKAATQQIPIVFFMGSDPVAIGLVASINRPGKNLTGFTSLSIEVAAKRLELQHELMPALTRIAFLTNPSNPVVAEVETRGLEAAARVLGLRLLILNAATPSDIDAAFAALAQQQAGALVVSTDTFFVSRVAQVVALAERNAIPATAKALGIAFPITILGRADEVIE